MNPRERVFAAIERKPPDCVPWTLDVGAFEGLSPTLLEIFKSKTGCESPEEYFNYDIRKIECELTANVPGATGDLSLRSTSDFEKYIREKYLPELPSAARVDEWGIGYTKASLAHFEKMYHPLSKVKTRKEIEEYPYPCFTGREIKKKINKIKAQGFVSIGYGGSIFEWSWWLRSQELLLVDMMINKSLAEAVMDKVTDYTIQVSQKMTKWGVDIICYYDDVGAQTGMQISPSLWREWLKPRWKKVFEIIRKISPQIKIFFHSDGYIAPIIPDLIEIGVDILNPVQPECMNPEKIKKEYGKYITLWGTIGCQSTMSHSDPQKIKEEIKKRIDNIGRKGGLIISPSNVLEPETPWENIITFVNSAKKYGKLF